MNPNDIDLSAARLAAFATSMEDGRERWTELRVYHHPFFRRPWIAEALGMSTVPGESTKRRVLASGTLDRALRLFDESDLGIIAKEGAREWAEEHGVPVTAGGINVACDREALAVLFGVPAAEVSVNAAGKALDVGESTLRMALKDGRDIRVPLRRLLPFIDRAAFQRAQEAARG